MTYRFGQHSFRPHEINRLAREVWDWHPEKIQKADRRKLRSWRGKLNGIELYTDKRGTVMHFTFSDGYTERMFTLETWEATNMLEDIKQRDAEERDYEYRFNNPYDNY